MNVDMVTLANNHTLDYGTDALTDTLATLNEHDILHVGAGENLQEAKEAVVIETNGKTIGFLGFSRVLPVASWAAGNKNPGLFSTYDSTIPENEIRSVKNTCDLVIVYVHWGIERNEYPEDYQRELAKKYIDAGADMVVGSHPHVLQGFEFYKNKPILYSLGNFLFSNSSVDTLLVKATIDEQHDIQINLIPCQRINGQMQYHKDPENLFRHLNEISMGAHINDSGQLKEQR